MAGALESRERGMSAPGFSVRAAEIGRLGRALGVRRKRGHHLARNTGCGIVKLHELSGACPFESAAGQLLLNVHAEHELGHASRKRFRCNPSTSGMNDEPALGERFGERQSAATTSGRASSPVLN